MRHERLQILVAWLFLFHVVTECGSHHAHSAEIVLPSAAGCPISAHTSAPCGHHHGSGHGSCESSQCLFVRNKTRSDSEPEPAAAKLVEVAACGAQSRAACPNSRHDQGTFAASQHIRLHLQFQVLLV